MRIEICGPIGAGKTSLARMLYNKGITACYEEFDKNPFWRAFYDNPGAHAFETETTFLLQHYHQVKKAKEPIYVFDFSLIQDLAFAKMGLNGTELRAFDAVYRECVTQVGSPDLTILLTCPTKILLDRIRSRARDEEINITGDFLEALSSATRTEFQRLGNDSNTLTIQTDLIDFTTPNDESEELYEKIIDYLKK